MFLAVSLFKKGEDYPGFGLGRPPRVRSKCVLGSFEKVSNVSDKPIHCIASQILGTQPVELKNGNVVKIGLSTRKYTVLGLDTAGLSTTDLNTELNSQASLAPRVKYGVGVLEWV